MFITFEGIDGSGKSTQINLLADYLKSIGYDVVCLREPGGTEFSETIRNLLLNSSFKINPTTELFLFEAARSELVENVIKPALDSGKVVICDRFYDSTTAYQGYGRGLELNKIGMFNEMATGHIKPDLTFFLNLPLNQANERAKDRLPDKIESSGNDFFIQVMDGFSQIAKDESERCIVINSSGTVEATHLIIVEEFNRKLKNYNKNLKSNNNIQES